MKTVRLLASLSLVFATTASAQTPPPPPAAPVPEAPPAAPTPAPVPPQPYAPMPPGYAQPGYTMAPAVRQGFLIGFALGGGSMNCQDCPDEDALKGLGLEFHIGGLLTPSLGLMFDGSGISHQFEDEASLVQAVSTIAVQFWVVPQFWLKVGFGRGQLSATGKQGEMIWESESGSAALFALGFEIIHSDTFGLDIQLRGATVEYDHYDTFTNGSLLLGANWY